MSSKKFRPHAAIFNWWKHKICGNKKEENGTYELRRYRIKSVGNKLKAGGSKNYIWILI